MESDAIMIEQQDLPDQPKALPPIEHIPIKKLKSTLKAKPTDQVLAQDEGYSSDDIGNAFMTEFGQKNIVNTKGIRHEDLQI